MGTMCRSQEFLLNFMQNVLSFKFKALEQTYHLLYSLTVTARLCPNNGHSKTFHYPILFFSDRTP